MKKYDVNIYECKDNNESMNDFNMPITHTVKALTCIDLQDKLEELYSNYNVKHPLDKISKDEIIIKYLYVCFRGISGHKYWYALIKK